MGEDLAARKCPEQALECDVFTVTSFSVSPSLLTPALQTIPSLYPTGRNLSPLAYHSWLIFLQHINWPEKLRHPLSPTQPASLQGGTEMASAFGCACPVQCAPGSGVTSKYFLQVMDPSECHALERHAVVACFDVPRIDSFCLFKGFTPIGHSCLSTLMCPSSSSTCEERKTHSSHI